MHNMKKRSRMLAVFVLLQMLVLIGMALSYYAIDWYGEEIQLKTSPVDPRDQFYGDYVILNYEMSQLPIGMWKGEDLPKDGDKVYVLLQPSQSEAQLYDAVRVSANAPKPGVDEVVLKARVNYSSEHTIWLRYGLERYYVPEGTGQELEDRREQMNIRVGIAPWGQAKVNGFHHK